MVNFLNKFRSNFFLAFVITLIFIVIEQSFRIYNELLIFNLTTKAFFEQFIINLLIVSIVSKRAILVAYSILSLFVWFQMVHFSYYGNWIFPLEYILFFTQFGEVIGTFTTVLEITIVPTICFIVLLLSTFIVVSRFEIGRAKVRYLSIFIIIVILFLPLRIYINNDYARNSKPNFEHCLVKNSALTLSNLIGVVIPHKISGNSGLEQPVINTPPIDVMRPNIDIVLIIGESLHRDYMSLYGYTVDTTPFLNSLRHSDSFIHLNGIGSGVATDIAVPSLLNMIEKPDGVPQILSTNTCLFKMAKENGFNTYFYSSQSQNELKGIKSYMCPSYLDTLKDGSYFTQDSKVSSLDENLVSVFDEIDFSTPSFITLQQRASHTPFLEYIPKGFRPYNNKNTKNLPQYTIDYINSIRYTDMVIERIINKIKEKSRRPTYVVFTSDHTTNIDDKNRRGHGLLHNDYIYKVPFFVYEINSSNVHKNNFGDFPYISHYQISHYISTLLGYRSGYDIFNTKENYFVCGHDLSGLGGFVAISFDKENKPYRNYSAK